MSRILPLFDAVYRYLRGATDVRQTGRDVALSRRDGTMEIGFEDDHVDVAIVSLLA